MRALGRITTIVVLAGAAMMTTFQLLDGPARYVIVSGHSMEPTLSTGDLAFVVRHDSYRRGDVVAYHVPDGEPGAGAVVIHRVVGGSGRTGYVTQGDNRDGRDIWRPKSDDVIGTMAFQIPGAGLVPDSLGSPVGLGIGAGLLAFFLLTGARKARPTEHPIEPRAQPVRQVVSIPAAARAGPASRPTPSPLVVTAAGVAVGVVVLWPVSNRPRNG
jgi:signal peptidase I